MSPTAPFPLSAPPTPLTLVSASYLDDPPELTLVFDRAINIGGLVGTAILVDDAEQTYLLYNSSGGAALLDAVTVKLTLVSIDDPTGPGILLSVSALSGIVAVNDGGTWPGVTNLSLPFP